MRNLEQYPITDDEIKWACDEAIALFNKQGFIGDIRAACIRIAAERATHPRNKVNNIWAFLAILITLLSIFLVLST